MDYKIIEITPKVFGVIVDDDAYDFEFIHNKTRIGYKVDYRLFKIDLPKGNFKIHGTASLPELKFDFIYGTGSYDTMTLKSRIKKAISDKGLLLVNPYEDVAPTIEYTGNTFESKGVIVNADELIKFEESESKVLKGKLLIIEKI